jgi:ectoine hydroxylase
MRLSDSEKAAYQADGYLIRPRVFAADEIGALRATVEAVNDSVVARATRDGAGPETRMADGHRIQMSSRAAIQWEWREGSRAIRLVEPFTHLDPRFEALWDDERFVAPMQDIVGAESVAPFTSKLNMKRAEEGSEFPYHQDYPYWYVVVGDTARDIATGVLFLDDATADNGAIRVLPRSHQNGPARRDRAEASGFLCDTAALDTLGEVTAEAPAGSILFFGSLLVHRSSPNNSGNHRRAILLSFQPADRPRLHDLPWRPERVHDLP